MVPPFAEAMGNLDKPHCKNSGFLAKNEKKNGIFTIFAAQRAYFARANAVI